MRTFFKILGGILLTLVLLVAFASGYLYLRHPFVFQDYSSILPLILSPPEIREPDPAVTTIEAFDALAAELLAENAIPGAAVALVGDGKVLWSKGYGFANIEAQQPATADTPFMIGSISKAVTGVAIMHAVENGTLDLDADINEYLSFEIRNPRLPEGRPITLRHLATHTSGLIDREWLYANSYTNGDPTVLLEDFVRDYFAESGANFDAEGNFLPSQPGEASEYSNIATGLAGHALGAATGTRLDAYTEEYIFGPLSMNNTGWFLADFADTSEIAQPYGFAGQPHPHYGYPTWPEGQLRTSANDLARLLAMVMNEGELDGERILAESTVKEMLRKQPFPALESVSGEGIFWSYIRSGGVGHNGGDLGVTSAMYFNPESKIGVVVLTNASISRAAEPVFSLVRQVVNGESSSELIASLKE